MTGKLDGWWVNDQANEVEEAQIHMMEMAEAERFLHCWSSDKGFSPARRTISITVMRSPNYTPNLVRLVAIDLTPQICIYEASGAPMYRVCKNLRQTKYFGGLRHS